MRYKVLRIIQGLDSSAMLHEFAKQDHDTQQKIFHSMRSIEDYISEKADKEIIVHSLAFEDEDDLNSIAISSAQSGQTLSHYLIIRENRLEFNMDVFAEGFFYDIKIKDTDKKLSIKSDLDDIIQLLLKDADVR